MGNVESRAKDVVITLVSKSTGQPIHEAALALAQQKELKICHADFVEMIDTFGTTFDGDLNLYATFTQSTYECICHCVKHSRIRMIYFVLDYVKGVSKVNFGRLFGEALQQNSTLKEIEMHSEAAGVRCSVDLADPALEEALSTSTTLERFYVSDGGLVSKPECGAALARILNKNTSLEEVDFSSSKLNSDWMEAFETDFKGNNTLQRFGLTWDNTLDDRAFCTLARCLPKFRALETFEGEYCQAVGDGVLAIGKALADNNATRIKRLTIGDDSPWLLSFDFVAFTRYLRQNTSLHSVRIESVERMGGGESEEEVKECLVRKSVMEHWPWHNANVLPKEVYERQRALAFMHMHSETLAVLDHDAFRCIVDYASNPRHTPAFVNRSDLLPSQEDLRRSSRGILDAEAKAARDIIDEVHRNRASSTNTVASSHAKRSRDGSDTDSDTEDSVAPPPGKRARVDD